tara:strand:+ start:892 stop:1647 length:756 start_codon:yes stop_codon:yes gene_type:complete
MEVSPAKRRRIDVEEAGDVAHFTCPITLAFPVDPVIAEDGHTYDRSAITRWISMKQSSPMTGLPMQDRLVASAQIKSWTRILVQRGVGRPDQRQAVEKCLQDEELVSKVRSQAEAGSASAMRQMGFTYQRGKYGVSQNYSTARHWFERAAYKNDVQGMALYGSYLLEGKGGPVDSLHGILFTSIAAHKVDLAAYELGWLWTLGTHGVTKDEELGRYWLRLATSGKLEYNNLAEHSRVRTEKFLLDLTASSP